VALCLFEVFSIGGDAISFTVRAMKKLYIFITENDATPVQVFEVSTIGITPEKNLPGFFCFGVRSPRTTLICGCPEKSDQEMWITALDSHNPADEDPAVIPQNSLCDFHAQDIDGKDFDFKATAGKIVMVVNVASR